MCLFEYNGLSILSKSYIDNFPLKSPIARCLSSIDDAPNVPHFIPLAIVPSDIKFKSPLLN